MINRTHAPTAASNYEIRMKLKVFCHCVISVTVAVLCTSVNVSGEAFQGVEKIENETNNHQPGPLQTSIIENSPEGANHFVQPFTEENPTSTSSRVRMCKKCSFIKANSHYSETKYSKY